MWKKKRHQVIAEIMRPVFAWYFKHKYKCSFDEKVSFPEGAIVISNHVTVMDEFMIGSLFKEHLYYMASMDIFQHFLLGHIIDFLVKPIPKEKSNKGDLQAIRTCCKIAKENSSICIFVEGNRTFTGEQVSFDDSIAKLVKLVKKPLVLCNVLGGYGTDPRFSNKLRKGRMHVGIKKIYSADEVKAMSNDELYQTIKDGINVDNFNFHNQYKSNRRAEYIERVVYRCPICGKLHTLRSKKNIVKCHNCGLEVTYNEDLTLTGNNKEFNFKYLKDWYHWQIAEIKKEEYNESTLIYEEEVCLVNPRLHKSKKKIGKGLLKFYSDKLEFIFKKKTLIFNFDEIEAMTILGKKKMNFYVNGITYQYFNDKRINMIKYLNMFYLLKSRKEGGLDEFMGL